MAGFLIFFQKTKLFFMKMKKNLKRELTKGWGWATYNNTKAAMKRSEKERSGNDLQEIFEK